MGIEKTRDTVGRDIGRRLQCNRSERLKQRCRYVTRPAICLDRLTVRFDGKIQYELKNPFRDVIPYINPVNISVLLPGVKCSPPNNFLTSKTGSVPASNAGLASSIFLKRFEYPYRATSKGCFRWGKHLSFLSVFGTDDGQIQ